MLCGFEVYSTDFDAACYLSISALLSDNIRRFLIAGNNICTAKSIHEWWWSQRWSNSVTSAALKTSFRRCYKGTGLWWNFPRSKGKSPTWSYCKTPPKCKDPTNHGDGANDIDSVRSHRLLNPRYFRHVERMKRQPAHCEHRDVRDAELGSPSVRFFAFGKLSRFPLWTFSGSLWHTCFPRRARDQHFHDEGVTRQHDLARNLCVDNLRVRAAKMIFIFPTQAVKIPSYPYTPSLPDLRHTHLRTRITMQNHLRL